MAQHTSQLSGPRIKQEVGPDSGRLAPSFDWPDAEERQKRKHAKSLQLFYWNELRATLDSHRGQWIAIRDKKKYRFYGSLQELLDQTAWWDKRGGFYEEIGNEITGGDHGVLLDAIHASAQSNIQILDK